jgi:hypothetical protein
VRLSLSIASVTVIALVTPLTVGITSDALAVEQGSPSKTTGTLNPQPPPPKKQGFQPPAKTGAGPKTAEQAACDRYLYCIQHEYGGILACGYGPPGCKPYLGRGR